MALIRTVEKTGNTISRSKLDTALMLLITWCNRLLCPNVGSLVGVSGTSCLHRVICRLISEWNVVRRSISCLVHSKIFWLTLNVWISIMVIRRKRTGGRLYVCETS